MDTLYFIVNREVPNLETMEPLFPVGKVLTAGDIEYYHKEYGIDHVPCEVAIGISAAKTLLARVLAQ